MNTEQSSISSNRTLSDEEYLYLTEGLKQFIKIIVLECQLRSIKYQLSKHTDLKNMFQQMISVLKVPSPDPAKELTFNNYISNLNKSIQEFEKEINDINDKISLNTLIKKDENNMYLEYVGGEFGGWKFRRTLVISCDKYKNQIELNESKSNVDFKLTWNDGMTPSTDSDFHTKFIEIRNKIFPKIEQELGCKLT